MFNEIITKIIKKGAQLLGFIVPYSLQTLTTPERPLKKPCAVSIELLSDLTSTLSGSFLKVGVSLVVLVYLNSCPVGSY
jgi:hypothetical protein